MDEKHDGPAVAAKIELAVGWSCRFLEAAAIELTVSGDIKMKFLFNL